MVRVRVGVDFVAYFRKIGNNAGNNCPKINPILKFMQ